MVGQVCTCNSIAFLFPKFLICVASKKQVWQSARSACIPDFSNEITHVLGSVTRNYVRSLLGIQAADFSCNLAKHTHNAAQ